jgi:hypothetical protein
MLRLMRQTATAASPRPGLHAPRSASRTRDRHHAAGCHASPRREGSRRRPSATASPHRGAPRAAPADVQQQVAHGVHQVVWGVGVGVLRVPCRGVRQVLQLLKEARARREDVDHRAGLPSGRPMMRAGGPSARYECQRCQRWIRLPGPFPAAVMCTPFSPYTSAIGLASPRVPEAIGGRRTRSSASPTRTGHRQ